MRKRDGETEREIKKENNKVGEIEGEKMRKRK